MSDEPKKGTANSGAWIAIGAGVGAAIGAAFGAATGDMSVRALAGNPPLSGLSWMSGCWSAVDGEPGSGEFWTRPAGSSILGISRTVRGGKTVSFEFLRIAAGDDGKTVLVASPSGQETATFALLSQSDSEVIFENPQHDFPQRIIYRLMPGNMLVARIEGNADGEAKGVDFPMVKTECDERVQ